MGASDNERIRQEAADAVTSRPPGPSDSHVDEAIKRYLGGEMYHALGQKAASKRRDQGEPTAPSKDGKP